MSGENAYGQNSRSFTMEGWKSKCENEKDVYLLQPLFTKLAISKIYKEYERSCSPNITLETLKSKKMKWKRNKKSANLLVFEGEKGSQFIISSKTRHQEKEEEHVLASNHYQCQKVNSLLLFIKTTQIVPQNKTKKKVKKTTSMERTKQKKLSSCFRRNKHPFLLFIGSKRWGNQDLV